MPELPEVETVCRTLEPRVLGMRVTGLEVREPRLRWKIDTSRLSESIMGQSVKSVTRRAKYVQVFLSGEMCLLIHLGMTGRLSVVAKGALWETHDHVSFELDTGCELRFNDTRRFGSIDVCPVSQLDMHPRLVHLGPEPLGSEFDGTYLHSISRGVRQPIKAFVMDAKRVVGVGNIYACEALFMAGVHPKARAGRLGQTRCERIVDSIQQVLNDSIERGGTTIKDFENAAGKPGAYGVNLLVYGREGESCPRCSNSVRRFVQGGRSTFYCPGCQYV